MVRERIDALKEYKNNFDALIHVLRYLYALKMISRSTSKFDVVLDLGCGYGYGSFLLNCLGKFRVIALDIDCDSLLYANTRYKGPDYICADALHLPFRNDVFTGVIALEVIEHVRDGQNLIVEVRRTLSKGGMFILSTPNKRRWLEFIRRKIFRRRFYEINPYHLREYDMVELIKMLKVEKFKVVKVIGFIIPILYRRFRFLKLLSLYIAHLLWFFASNIMIGAILNDHENKRCNTYM